MTLFENSQFSQFFEQRKQQKQHSTFILIQASYTNTINILKQFNIQQLDSNFYTIKNNLFIYINNSKEIIHFIDFINTISDSNRSLFVITDETQFLAEFDLNFSQLVTNSQKTNIIIQKLTTSVYTYLNTRDSETYPIPELPNYLKILLFSDSQSAVNLQALRLTEHNFDFLYRLINLFDGEPENETDVNLLAEPEICFYGIQKDAENREVEPQKCIETPEKQEVKINYEQIFFSSNKQKMVVKEPRKAISLFKK